MDRMNVCPYIDWQTFLVGWIDEWMNDEKQTWRMSLYIGYIYNIPVNELMLKNNHETNDGWIYILNE